MLDVRGKGFFFTMARGEDLVVEKIPQVGGRFKMHDKIHVISLHLISIIHSLGPPSSPLDPATVTEG